MTEMSTSAVADTDVLVASGTSLGRVRAVVPGSLHTRCRG
jgi:hypothetical protein